MQTSVDAWRVQTALLARVVCHILVDEIPERGLGELYESLTGIYEFHLEQPAQPRPALASVRRVDATLGPRVEPPPFQYDDEE